ELMMAVLPCEVKNNRPTDRASAAMAELRLPNHAAQSTRSHNAKARTRTKRGLFGIADLPIADWTPRPACGIAACLPTETGRNDGAQQCCEVRCHSDFAQE